MPTVLITGASRGLGKEFTRQYAADGWRVIATCRTMEGGANLRDVEGNLEVHLLDILDHGAIEKFSTELKNESIDVLLNNAGVYGVKGAGFGESNYEAWTREFQTNVHGPMKMAESFIEQVARSEQKIIATLTSKMGSISDNQMGGSYVYRSSKAAMNAVNKSLSIDLKGRGVSCVALHPGWVRTDMGGPQGLIDAPESVNGMRQVIGEVDLSKTGHFYNYDGTEIPW
ncbi:MAG: SDR family oxidoreductase [Rhodospirillales bacterium]|nr:SDR family oxidoreductase [Rhodospirillales bacterium]